MVEDGASLEVSDLFIKAYDLNFIFGLLNEWPKSQAEIFLRFVAKSNGI